MKILYIRIASCQMKRAECELLKRSNGLNSQTLNANTHTHTNGMTTKWGEFGHAACWSTIGKHSFVNSNGLFDTHTHNLRNALMKLQFMQQLFRGLN